MMIFLVDEGGGKLLTVGQRERLSFMNWIVVVVVIVEVGFA